MFIQLINAELNTLEPLVDGFLSESDALLNLTREMNILKERHGLTKRAHVAKEIAANFHQEVSNKLFMFTKIKKEKQSYSPAMLNNFRFMCGRLKEMAANLERAQANIGIAMEQIS